METVSSLVAGTKRLALIGVVAVLQSVRGSAEEADPLAELKSSYEAARGRIVHACEQQKQDALAEYGAALERAAATLRKAGNLDGYLAVEAEQKRLASDGSVPEEERVSPALAEAARACRRALASAAPERQTVPLMRAYVGRLGSLIRQLTQNGKLTEALAAKAEKDRVAFELADLESKQPDTSTIAKEASPPVPSLTAGLKRGLVLHYAFEDRSGQAIADVSGRGHEGVAHGTERIEKARIGAGRLFNGTDDYIDAGTADDLKMREGITISVWIRPERLSGYQNVVSDHSPSGNSGKILRLQGRRLEFLLGPEGSTEAGLDLDEPGRWYHAVARYDGKTMGLFVDRMKNQEPRESGLPRNGNPILIAKSGFGEWYHGGMDELMVWNRALSDAEVRQLGVGPMP